MIATQEQLREFETITRPVMEWLNRNCHPHVTVIIEPTRTQLLEGICAYPTVYYVQD
jgi:hypothetical protein